MKHALIMAILLISSFANAAGIRTAKLFADFSKSAKNYIDTVYLMIGYETTFILPENKQIKKVIRGNPDSIDVNGTEKGRFVHVIPTEKGLKSSLCIVTTDDNIYKFNLIERSNEVLEYDVMSEVVIVDKPQSFEVNLKPNGDGNSSGEKETVDNQNSSKKADSDKISMLKKLNYSYKVKKNYFAVKSVYDDGVFTYLYMPQANERPAIFYSTPANKNRLEPVRYTENNDENKDIVIVHRILAANESFVLKLGSKVCKITKK